MTDSARTAPSRAHRWSSYIEYDTKDRAMLLKYARSRIWAYHIPASAIDAEDVVQDALTEVLARWSTIAEPAAYARSIIRRRINENVNDEKANGTPVADMAEYADARSLLIDQDGRPLDPVFQKVCQDARDAEIRRTVEDALAGSRSDNQRRAFELRHLEELSVAEIAINLDMSESTTKTHIHRATKTIRDKLIVALGSASIAVLTLLVSINGWIGTKIQTAGDGHRPPHTDHSHSVLSSPWTLVGVLILIVGFALTSRFRSWITERRYRQREEQFRAGKNATDQRPQFSSAMLGPHGQSGAPGPASTSERPDIGYRGVELLTSQFEREGALRRVDPAADHALEPRVSDETSDLPEIRHRVPEQGAPHSVSSNRRSGSPRPDRRRAYFDEAEHQARKLAGKRATERAIKPIWKRAWKPSRL